MDEPIEELYFKWLYSKVAAVASPTPSSTYWKLFRNLHEFEFVWLLNGDDNRAEDGLELRNEFLLLSGISRHRAWDHIGCSVLEMLIAFSRRAEFMTEVPSRDWFWIFMVNLGLNNLHDASTRISKKATDAIYRFVWRTYSPTGYGGLFPLEHGKDDERKVEIWYQFCAYVAEHEE